MFRRDSKVLRSKLGKRDLNSIQRGTLNYAYRGLPCLKNPFDLALYTHLLNSLKPKTIIEVGSASGGSAFWFSDQTATLGLGTRIFSLDISPPTNLSIDRVEFIQGDVYDLENSQLPEILKNSPRPLLVIEDGPHTYEGCRSALAFFHPYMRPGEYIIVEDGIVHELGLVEYQDGPNRAITDFLVTHAANCEIDRDYCDYFGQNFTWATNGYIKYVEVEE